MLSSLAVVLVLCWGTILMQAPPPSHWNPRMMAEMSAAGIDDFPLAFMPQPKNVQRRVKRANALNTAIRSQHAGCRFNFGNESLLSDEDKTAVCAEAEKLSNGTRAAFQNGMTKWAHDQGGALHSEVLDALAVSALYQQKRFTDAKKRIADITDTKTQGVAKQVAAIYFNDNLTRQQRHDQENVALSGVKDDMRQAVLKAVFGEQHRRVLKNAAVEKQEQKGNGADGLHVAGAEGPTKKPNGARNANNTTK